MSGSATHPSALSHTTRQSRKCPWAVLARTLSPVAFGAFEGRTAKSVSAAGPAGGATSLPRLPMTVGVPVMLFALGSSLGVGSGVRVHAAVVLRQ